MTAIFAAIPSPCARHFYDGVEGAARFRPSARSIQTIYRDIYGLHKESTPTSSRDCMIIKNSMTALQLSGHFERHELLRDPSDITLRCLGLSTRSRMSHFTVSLSFLPSTRPRARARSLFPGFARSVGTRSLRPGAASLRAITHVPHVAGRRSPRPRHRVTTYSRLVKAARIPHAVTYGHCNLQAVANNERKTVYEAARAVHRQPFDRSLARSHARRSRAVINVLLDPTACLRPAPITLSSGLLQRPYGYTDISSGYRSR